MVQRFCGLFGSKVLIRNTLIKFANWYLTSHKTVRFSLCCTIGMFMGRERPRPRLNQNTELSRPSRNGDDKKLFRIPRWRPWTSRDVELSRLRWDQDVQKTAPDWLHRPPGTRKPSLHTSAAHWAVLQKERSTGIVLPTLPAPGQTRLKHHRLRYAKKFTSFSIRTERFRKSFVPYCLNLYD